MLQATNPLILWFPHNEPTNEDYKKARKIPRSTRSPKDNDVGVLVRRHILELQCGCTTLGVLPDKGRLHYFFTIDKMIEIMQKHSSPENHVVSLGVIYKYTPSVMMAKNASLSCSLQIWCLVMCRATHRHDSDKRCQLHAQLSQTATQKSKTLVYKFSV